MTSSTNAAAAETTGHLPPGTRRLTIPGFGTLLADDAIRERVDRAFSVPMTVLSLGFLVLMGIELWLAPQGPAATAIDATFGAIWAAFTVELVVKTLIAESRFAHLKKNWIDVAVVLLPFLRPLRVAAQVANAARALRLRGAGTKLARSSLSVVAGLSVGSRAMKRLGLASADDTKAPERMTREELIAEVKRLRRLHAGESEAPPPAAKAEEEGEEGAPGTAPPSPEDGQASETGSTN